jgi:cardiolipin synthase
MRTHHVPRRFRTADERYVQGNVVALLRDGEQAFPAMLRAIAAAERQILLEMYWFDSDAIGQRFAEALINARSRGVEVAVLYDALGSLEADTALFDDMRAAGIEVVEFNPLLPWRRRFKAERLTRRDHRKILVVDGEVGFTGGINLNDHWLPVSEGGDGWRDDMVMVRGPAVSGFVQLFRRTWHVQGGSRLRAPSVVPSGSLSGTQNVRVLGENRLRHRREIVNAYLYQIYGAKSRVWLTNSYFLPEGAVVRALKRAANRGVDVRILLPAYSDVEVVRRAGRAVWRGLLRHGVRIFEWHKSVLHSKTAVVDSKWSTIGTFNMDYRSLMFNLEVNVAILDEGFGAMMDASFERDIAASREIDARNFSFRPVAERLLDYGLYRFRKLL